MKSSYQSQDGNLERLEESISKKSQENTRYAFSVILSEKEYKKLIKTCTNELLFQLLPQQFPWCHIKLLTETYVRIENKKEMKEEHTQEEIATTLYNEKELPYKLWDSIPDSLQKVNLEHTRDEGGPWSIVANVRLHAGIPKKRVKEIIKMLKAYYKKYGNIHDALNKFIIHPNFNRLSLSKYVKKAFEDTKIQKMFFLWILKIIDFCNEHDISALKNHPYIPDYIINYFEDSENIVSYKRKKIPKLKYKAYEGLFFNEISRDISYKILVDKLPKIYDNLHSRLKNYIDKQKKPPGFIITLSLRPNDFPLEFSLLSDPVDFKKTGSFSTLIEAFIFKSNGELITKECERNILNIEDDKIFIISRKEIINIEIPPLKMVDAWWDWNLYIVELNQINGLLNIDIGYPYEEIKYIKSLKSSNYVEWNSEQLLTEQDNLKIFGGSKVPIFKLCKDDFTNDEFENIWINIDIFHNSIIHSSIKAQFEDEGEYYIWKPVAMFDDPGIYLFNVKIFDFQFESELIEDIIIWIKDFKFYIKPKNAIFPDQKSSIVIEGFNHKKIMSDIIEEPTIKNNRVEYHFSKKPLDCNPVISIELKHPWIQHPWIDVAFKLNYISCKLLYNMDDERCNVDLLEKYLDYNQIETIISKDSNAKIVFYCLKDDSQFLLYTEEKGIQKKLYFNNFEDSVLLNELKNHKKLLLLNNNTKESRTLIQESKKKSFWSYSKIFDEFKNEIFNEIKKMRRV